MFTFLLALPLFAANDANEILKRFIEADKQNGVLARQYAFVEQADHFNFDKAGTAKKFGSQTYEIVFVEGEIYKKLVARNDKPLDAKEGAKEKKKLEQVAEQRRKERHSTMFRKVVSLGGYDQLLTHFDNTVAGEEELRGRKCWVVLSNPRTDVVPADDKEKEMMSFQKKLWIDKEEQQVLRSLSTVVGKHIVFMPGTVVQFDSEKIGGGVWMQTSGLIDGHLQFAKLVKPKVRTEYTYSKFQKFDVQSTITMEPAK